jgi:hypothetical protein
MSFSKDELERYARHIMLKDVGGPGQQRLKAASVALIGAGGLGSPAALYLAAAGVGRMRLIDPDRVALSNLQRQILFRTEDAGRSKVEAAAEQLTALNPNVTVEIVDKSIDATNADALLDGCTVVLIPAGARDDIWSPAPSAAGTDSSRHSCADRVRRPSKRSLRQPHRAPIRSLQEPPPARSKQAARSPLSRRLRTPVTGAL